ncbi:hypothetical protein [Brachyspira hyodysenteriae]|uniref:hypothetical protein n=1 Tax=Brachyspira hyodysenteriae TaxID=159 RepID=UPI00063D8E46|nr:hypothetical protein [Brachyspira hyodysenteriae]KLI16443.1 hypothetical protein SU45_07590 [Brachyspira hyodysenteriae]KLI60846.1 hypothetical protein SZ46_05940 [Brachyspira hyodysenteriae]
MKRVFIVLIFIFSLSVITFGEELKFGITNKNSMLNIYDNSVHFTHKDYGTIMIKNENISILSCVVQDKNNLLFINLTDKSIYLGVNKDFFKSQPIAYYLDGTNRKYDIDNVLFEEGDKTYFFEFPLEYFYEIKEDNISLIIASFNKVEGWAYIYDLITYSKMFEGYIKDYPLYQKYLK